MKLQNSYIFLKNPYAKLENHHNNQEEGKIVLSVGNNLYSYLKHSFPSITQVNDYGSFYKKKYVANLQYGNNVFNAEFIITEVVDTRYLDIIVEGKSKLQIVKCLEHIQYTLLTSGIRKKYIDIVSYDAVSEYYCNKIYPKLNTLERNLRKLLFNIYIINFGRDYYKATVDEDLQGKIKGVINVDSSKEEKDHIKADYKTSTRKEAEEIERLQRFFYSFEYNDIQKLLFTPSWTSADEAEKTKFLNEHNDLSELSDEELREVFSKYVPKSDWERFFSKKINISDIRELIEQIRLYRNSVAHFKFFYKAKYDECNKLVNRLNSAIITAIKITEDKDFAEKNAKPLSQTLQNIMDGFATFTKSLVEMSQKIIENTISPALSVIKSIHDDTVKKIYSNSRVFEILAEETKKRQELFESIKPATALIQGFQPHINETQNILNSCKIDIDMSNMIKTNIQKFNSQKFNIPEPINLSKINLNTSYIGTNISTYNQNKEIIVTDNNDEADD